MRTLDIVFVEADTAETSPPSLQFVEVENERGESGRVGEWITRADGYRVLRLKVAE